MQLIAKDGSKLVSAVSAEKGKNYFCLECNSSLRVRKGPHKQAHFFHTTTARKCKQSQKSQQHIELQLQVLKACGTEAAMEHAFESIGRIADVAWHARKVIFEIQCSCITKQEVFERTQDYSRIGYQVIWILHDKRFNQKKLSDAEAALRKMPCYYTDIDEKGRGGIYDQFEIIQGHARRFKGPKLPIQIQTIFSLTAPLLPEKTPLAIMSRCESWNLFCRGDLYDHFRTTLKKRENHEQMAFIEALHLGPKKSKKRLNALTIVARYYRLLLQSLMPKSSRREL